MLQCELSTIINVVVKLYCEEVLNLAMMRLVSTMRSLMEKVVKQFVEGTLFSASRRPFLLVTQDLALGSCFKSIYIII